MLAALQNRGFRAGDTFLGLSYEHGEEIFKKKRLEDYEKLVHNVDAGLKKAGFTGDLDLDNISDDVWSNIQQFALSIQAGKPIPLTCTSPEDDEEMTEQFITILSCGPLRFALLCSPAYKGHYYCENLFHARKIDIDETQTPNSPYLLLDPQRLPFIDNLNYQELINSFDEITYNRNALLYLLLFSALNYCYLNGLSSS